MSNDKDSSDQEKSSSSSSSSSSSNEEDEDSSSTKQNHSSDLEQVVELNNLKDIKSSREKASDGNNSQNGSTGSNVVLIIGGGNDDDSLLSTSSAVSSATSSKDSMTSFSLTSNEMNDDDDVDDDEADDDDVDDQDDLEKDDLLMIDKEGINHNQSDSTNNSSNTATSSTTTTTISTSSLNNNTTNTTINKSSDESSTESSSSILSNNNNNTTTTTDTRRRVKLYMLNANRTWDDRGTGHVSSSYIDRLNGMSLLVKAETDGSTLLESKIMADTAYQKQQDTLIVWSEGENYDLALSFQERIGCEEIWAKICQVQGKDPSVDITQDLIEDEDNELPPIEVNRLEEINSILTSSLTTATKKDNITLALESDNYILKLLELFRQLEERQDIPALQKFYEIFKNIFLLNKNSLIEIMLSDQAICDVIGVFEYDPNGARVREYQAKTNNNANNNQQNTRSQQQSSSFMTSSSLASSAPAPRALSSQSQSYFTSLPSSSETELMRLVREKRHREFLRNVSRFKEVIPLGKSELVSKIHQTYRVQYIQDVIMPSPSIFEDNMISTLSSVLFFNKIEIVTLIQEDEKFLKELFHQLSDEEPSFQEKRRDLVLFLKELCTFSHTLQNRETFIKTLSSLGLLQTIETLLVCDDPAIKLGAVDLLTYVVDYSPSMVREYALQQEINTDKPTEQYIINIIIEQMICDIDPDLGMAQQLSGILKMIIDPDNMLTTPGLNKTEKSEFLNYFYKHCIYYLTAPILAATVSPSSTTNTQSNNQFDLLLQQPSSGPLGTQSQIGGISTIPQTLPTLTNNNSNICLGNIDEPLRLAFENSCQAAQLLAIILELLTFCIEHHAYHIRTYLLQKEIVRRIMILTKSRHTFLVLTVIRFMRKLVGLKDEFYNRHIVTLNLFQPIVDAFLSNRGRYNLLDSAVIDLFEFIDHNDIYTLLNYTVERFWKCKLERVDYVRTFKSLKRHFDQQQHRNNNAQNTLMFTTRTGPGAGGNTTSPVAHHRFRRDPRQLDKEEDMWFNADDDDEEDECPDDDDDDDDEIGVGMNYHHADDDDDLIGGPPGGGPGDGSSPPESNNTTTATTTSSVLENRLALSSAASALSAAAAAADPIDYAAAAAAAAAAQHHHQYGQHGLSLHHHHHHHVGKLGTGTGNPGSVLHHHHHHHQLHISSLHQGSGTSTTTGSSGTGISSYNSLTAANSLYDNTGTASAGGSSTAVAFVDTPFFSSLASVATATSGSNTTSGIGGVSPSGGLISGTTGGKKKSNDRKLTINLNHKTTSFLATASGTIQNSNHQNNQNNQQQQQSTNVLNAFNSGLCQSLSSINSSIAAVAAAAAAGVQNNSNNVTSTNISSLTTPNHGVSQFRSTSSSPNVSNNNNQLQMTSAMGHAAHIAAAAAAFHNLNSANNTAAAAKTATETVLSRKALVDYPDEDSDEEESQVSEPLADQQRGEEEEEEDEEEDDDDVEEEEDDEDDVEDDHEEEVDDFEDSPSFRHSFPSMTTTNVIQNIRVTNTNSRQSSTTKSISLDVQHDKKRKDSCSLGSKVSSKQNQQQRRSLRLSKNTVANCTTNTVNQIENPKEQQQDSTTSRTNGSDDNNNDNHHQIVTSSSSTIKIRENFEADTRTITDEQEPTVLLDRNRKRKMTDYENERPQREHSTDAIETSSKQVVPNPDDYSLLPLSSTTNTVDTTVSEYSSNTNKRFRYSFVESDSTTMSADTETAMSVITGSCSSISSNSTITSSQEEQDAES